MPIIVDIGELYLRISASPAGHQPRLFAEGSVAVSFHVGKLGAQEIGHDRIDDSILVDVADIDRPGPVDGDRVEDGGIEIAAAIAESDKHPRSECRLPLQGDDVEVAIGIDVRHLDGIDLVRHHDRYGRGKFDGSLLRLGSCGQ